MEQNKVYKINKLLLILILILLSGNSLAERLLATKGFAGQPLLIEKDGNIQSCGIRFVGINTPTSKKETIWIADASLLIDKSGEGIAKASIIRSSIDRFNKARTPLFEPFKTFWVKAKKVKATSRIWGASVEVDPDGSKRYRTHAASVKGLYQAVVDKRPIQLSYKFEDDKKDFTIQGLVIMTDEELGQVSTCLSTL